MALLPLIADKRLRYYVPTPKSPSATSFIRKTLINIRKETENDCNDIKSVNDKVISQKNEYETLSLAPMSVLPNYQKMGIGSKLIEYGIKAAKKAGYTSIIVLGHSNYYLSRKSSL